MTDRLPTPEQIAARPESVCVRVWRAVPRVLADCEGCDWFRDVAGTTPSDRARAEAKRHVERTGHIVRVERSITTVIEPKR